MINNKGEIQRQIDLLELLNKENIGEKHPEGSFILFGFADENGLHNCDWYDKVGIKQGGKLKNIVRKPEEFQRVKGEDVWGIVQRFDNYVVGLFGKEYIEAEINAEAQRQGVPVSELKVDFEIN